MAEVVSTPDLIIPQGPRALLSLAGIFLIVGGVWYADRMWDEKGSAAYAKAVAAKKGKPSKAADDKTPLKQQQGAALIPKEELDAAFPFPVAFLLGWSLFGISFFSSIDGSTEFSLSVPSIISAIVSLALGWIASVPMGEAVKSRNGPQKTKLGMMFVSSWLILSLATVTVLSWLHLAFRLVGAVMIIASMKVLWKFRKMGDSWEQEGKPNPNPVVYNAGGPMFVFGWFLFWIGVAAVKPDEAAVPGIPLYFTLRTLLCLLSGCGMVPVVLVVDYAHDEGAEYLGFGTDGRFFGRFWESPIPFLSAWTLFGLASWFPIDFVNLSALQVTTLQIIILLNCTIQGFVAGILIQNALYKGDMAAKTRFSVPFVLLFMALAAEIGIGNGYYWLSFPGAILIILGQKTVFGDRKRGDYWMANNQQNNPNPIVYSWGEPFFMLGWILISLGMAIPFE